MILGAPGAPRKPPWRVAMARLAVAHLITYPLAFPLALAGIPFAAAYHEQRLLAGGDFGAQTYLFQLVSERAGFDPVEAAMVELVLLPSLWMTLAVMLWMHLAAVPWAVAAARAVTRGAPAPSGPYRFFLAASLLPTALLLALGAVGWVWLLVHPL